MYLSKMHSDKFWEIIDSVHTKSAGNMDRKCELLKVQLSALDDSELLDFIDHFDAADAAAYTWSLWGAAYVMNGGCSDDAFSDFRATLISQGRNVYERAMYDPESLAEIVFDEDDICYEGFQYVKNEVAEEKLGALPEQKVSFPDEPAGSEWDEEAVDQLYPRLSAKFSGRMNSDDMPYPSKPWWKFW